MRKLVTLIILFIAALTLTGCNSVSNERTTSTSQVNGTKSTNNLISDQTKMDKYTTAPPTLSAAELQGRKAIIKTAKGDIEIEFYGDVAPQTVSNFIFLAKEKFYDGLGFHRRVEGFVLQGGDPAGNGTGGPGYNVPAEISKKHLRGSVATARTGDEINPERASSGSQFYICLDDLPSLDDQYTVFGQVTKGMEVVDALQMGEKMISVEIL